jgi:formamidopyrimidine-DNA glycosylase
MARTSAHVANMAGRPDRRADGLVHVFFFEAMTDESSVFASEKDMWSPTYPAILLIARDLFCCLSAQMRPKYNRIIPFMPELPEVEVTRLSFADRIEGALIESIHMGKPLRWPIGCDVDELVGWRVGEVSRRGKYLWITLFAPDLSRSKQRSGGLLVHLGMSGSLAFSHRLPPAGVHDHFEMITSKGTLRLTDPRRFGAVVWGPSLDQGVPAKLLAGLGLEPFDPNLDGAYLHERLQGRKVSIKQALLAGDIVVGAGNIYACEALFRAGIDPRLQAGRLSKPRSERLVREVQGVLSQALAMGGSSLKDFKDAHGSQGHFQLSTNVYGREGQPCRICQTPIKRVTQGQRSTFYCPSCQKR